MKECNDKDYYHLYLPKDIDFSKCDSIYELYKFENRYVCPGSRCYRMFLTLKEVKSHYKNNHDTMEPFAIKNLDYIRMFIEKGVQ